MQAANERAMIPPAAQAADLRARRALLSVPIANADRLVLPDALATTIKLATRLLGGARSPGADRLQPAGR